MSRRKQGRRRPTTLPSSGNDRDPALTENVFRSRKLLQISISVALLAFFVSYLDWQSIVDFFHRANAWILGGLIAVFIGDRLFMAWKWFLLIRYRSSSVTLWAAVQIYFASSAIGLVLPLGGLGPDVARVAMLSRHGMSAEISVPSILVERIAGVVSAVVMMALSILLTLIFMREAAPARFASILLIFPLAGAGVIAAGAIGYLLFRSRRFVDFAGRLRARPAIDKYVVAIGWYANQRGLLLLSVGLAWLEQWAPIVAFYLACRGFDVPLTLLQCAAIVPLASILERLPISFAGLGVREAGIVFGASWFAVSRSDAFLVALTQHALYMLTVIPLGLLYFIRRNKVAATAAKDEP